MAKTQKTKKLKTTKKSETASTSINTKQKPLKKRKLKKRKTKPLPSLTTTTPHDHDTDSSSDSDSDFNDLSTLLEPYTKDQLINLISTAAVQNPSFYSLIYQCADGHVSHRQIFVHGLPFDITRETLLAAFEPFGEIESCNVVTDKVTGKAKGYAFILFKTRKAAALALKDPKKNINDRIVSCQLSSVGSIKDQDGGGGARKIYVSNVQPSINKEKLRAFFEKFGEIEIGPIGFDKETGKSRGFALFVYKTLEGAKKSLEEPHKMFEGYQLHCSVATDGKGKATNQVQGKQPVVVVQPQQQVHQPPQGPVLAAVAAAQNLAMFGQHPGLNPLYGGLYGNPSAATAVGAGGMINPALAGATSQGVVPTSQMGGFGVGSQSMLGAYRVGHGLQHVYPNTQIGQAGMTRAPGAGGSVAGYPSYKWYDLFNLDFNDSIYVFNFLVLCFHACSTLDICTFRILITFVDLEQLKFGLITAALTNKYMHRCAHVIFSIKNENQFY